MPRFIDITGQRFGMLGRWATRLQQTRNRRVTPKSAKHADEAAQ